MITDKCPFSSQSLQQNDEKIPLSYGSYSYEMNNSFQNCKAFLEDSFVEMPVICPDGEPASDACLDFLYREFFHDLFKCGCDVANHEVANIDPEATLSDCDGMDDIHPGDVSA